MSDADHYLSNLTSVLSDEKLFLDALSSVDHICTRSDSSRKTTIKRVLDVQILVIASDERQDG
eukprot:6009009-Pleurochrysis_carterae.AAC.1